MNVSSLTDYLGLISSYVPDNLIDGKQWKKFENITNILPSALTNFFGFECRLAESEPLADILVCADASEAGRRVLAANAYDIDIPEKLLQNSVWMNIRNFSTNWESEVSPLYEKVHNMWLEFDALDAVSEVPIPSCFFGPKNLYATPVPTSTDDAEHPYSWVWQNALTLLLGRNVSLSLERNLVQCFEALPENAYVFQIGMMLARQSDAVRLCIRDISPTETLDYLNRLGWSGDLEPLQNLLNDLSSFVERIDLDIDVADVILPKIGLECYLQKQPQFEERWDLFLDYLQKRDLCLPEKKQALLEFPGYIRQKMSPSSWPLSMKKITGLLGPQYEWVFFKGLHHIKLVYKNSRVTEAKSYLYVSRSMIKGV